MLRAPWIIVLVAVAACARPSLDSSDALGPRDAAQTGDGDAGPGPDASGMPDAEASEGDGGSSEGGATDGALEADASEPAPCEAPVGCDMVESQGSIDGADDGDSLVHEGSGEAWVAFEVTDSNKNATGNTRIGVSVELEAGDGYALRLMGDLSPAGAFRCQPAAISDEDPTFQTGIWGSFGPIAATTRKLAVHVVPEPGAACDGPWTLTIRGNPCPSIVGVGQEALGSCP